ncbi:phosphoribosyltransferase [Candidatus Micrarchaeota archaeon]|nr:phosphoribosyltransferase [Candidatus Micrarchaeota archaeon]
MEFLRISWEEAAKLCEELVHKTEYYKPDILVGVSRGGLVPLRIFSDVLGIKRLGVLGIQFYKKIGETSDFPEITHDLPIDVRGKKVLIIDDVADTGKSLIAAREYVNRKGAKEIKTATIHFKPHSILKPDYFVAVTTAWIIYPWERHEVERELKKK